MTDNRATLIAELAFDHRDSILRFMEEQATKLAVGGRVGEAAVLRATASTIKAKIDIEPGKGGIASPVDAIAFEVCSNLGGAMLRDIIQKERNEGAMRCYYATVWVAKKRLGWTQESIADHLDRDRSTIGSALKRADEIRKTDPEFRKVTDELTHGAIRCENCLEPLLHEMAGVN